MKKLIPILFMIVMLTGCSYITPDTPFFGGFVDTTPEILQQTHKSVRFDLVEDEGAKPWTINPKKKAFLGLIEYRPAWIGGGCSNHVVECKVILLKSGYLPEQLVYGYCSVFNDKAPDHVVLIVTEKDGTRYVLDYRYPWVMTPDRLNKIKFDIKDGQITIPYVWWSKVDNKWVKTKL